MIALPVLYTCRVYSTRLTEAACGRRRVAAGAKVQARGGSPLRSMSGSACKRCPGVVALAGGAPPIPAETVSARCLPPIRRVEPTTPPRRPGLLAPLPPQEGSKVPRKARAAPSRAPEGAASLGAAPGRPEPSGPSIDRWAHRRVMVTHEGRTLSVAEWARELGISHNALRMRRRVLGSYEAAIAHGDRASVRARAMGIARAARWGSGPA